MAFHPLQIFLQVNKTQRDQENMTKLLPFSSDSKGRMEHMPKILSFQGLGESAQGTAFFLTWLEALIPNSHTLDAWGPLRAKESLTAWGRTTEPAIPSTNTRGSKRLSAPGKEIAMEASSAFFTSNLFSSALWLLFGTFLYFLSLCWGFHCAHPFSQVWWPFLRLSVK